ncbi:MAG: hypothetical protein ABI474_11180 [Actinomycetota bacterium]
MKSLNGIRLIVISAVVLAGAVASVVVVMMFSTGSASSALAGMPTYMPGMEMSGSAPAPTASPHAPGGLDMPGLDMPGAHEHSHVTGAAATRPLAAVLGTFGGGTAAVLLSAGMLRRKDRARSLAKSAARIARRNRK